jgi:ABC-type transport system involved in cytochrome c biogenesis permease subunit
MLVAPLQPGEQWMTLGQAFDTQNSTHQTIDGFSLATEILRQYIAGNAGKFNEAVASYHARVAAALPKETSKAEFEARFNQIDPFTTCIVFYILCFTLIALSWLNFSPTYQATVYWSAVCVAGLTLLIHTIGLIARIYISGAPPVTNLASSAIFIAWGIVVLALGFEYFYRNGIGLVAASIAGVASLLIADGLAADGDTFKVLQAVLATNFWLATHVVCVTLGYASTFLAGLLGIIYVVRSAIGSLDKEGSRELARMIYGVACFAILFSFVGTVLGGIWADQSWGRFWGWDPKENGAVLVVLSNALLLHARWGGLVKARGIANFAIFGNIITAWSWFGTNMLGIGLHAYGFMEKAPTYLIGFVIAMLFLIGVNLFLPDPAERKHPKLAAAKI